MKIVTATVIALLGAGVAAWGVVLIHHSFALEIEHMFLLKTGSLEVPSSVAVNARGEAWTQVLVQVGLVLVGTVLATATLSALLISRNHRSLSDTTKPNPPKAKPAA